MPRKQNGWGTSKSLSFEPIKPVSKAKGYGAAGNYPSDRKYGASVTRSVIEKYDMDSDWAKWRKGYEYYMKAAWDELVVSNPFYATGGRLDPINPLDPAPGQEFIKATLQSVLYQGTDYELPTLFYGWEFPTKDADTNTHYVAKRTPEKQADLGTITEVWNNEKEYPDQKANREIWVKGLASVNARLLLQMEGERLTDTETEATLKYVLTEDQKPAVYKGKTFAEDAQENDINLQATTVRLRIPISSLEEGTQQAGTEYTVGQGLRKFKAERSASSVMEDYGNLVGNIIYVPDFYIERSFEDLQAAAWGDAADYFGTTILDVISDAQVFCLDPGVETLPPSMYDITTLPTIFSANAGTISLVGTYIFQKKQYNRFFPGKYVTASQVEAVASELSYAILPFTIQSAYVQGDTLIIESVPFSSEIKIYPELTAEAFLVFTDYSFCKYTQDGEWLCMNTDVLPWQDEVFTAGKPIEPAVTYTCSCPDHSHSILSAPQATMDLDTRKQNRQRRYPLPSVMGLDRWQGLGVEQISGRLASWETEEHRLGLRLCKHAIAARFIEKVKVIEPSKYPSVDSRIKFEKKLEEEMEKFGYDFNLSYRRSQLSLTEIVFALAQGLNLDGIETAYVLFNTY